MLRGTLVFFVRAAHAVLDVVIDDEVQLLIREAVTAARGRWLTPSTVTASPSMSNAARHAPLRYLEHVASQDQLAGIQQSTDIGIHDITELVSWTLEPQRLQRVAGDFLRS